MATNTVLVRVCHLSICCNYKKTVCEFGGTADIDAAVVRAFFLYARILEQVSDVSADTR